MLPKNPYGSSIRSATSPRAVLAHANDAKSNEISHRPRRAPMPVLSELPARLDKCKFILDLSFSSVELAFLAVMPYGHDVDMPST